MIAAASISPALQSVGLRAQEALTEVSGQDFQVFIVDPSRHQISLHWKNAQGKPYRSLKAVKLELNDQGKTVLALMNSGIYDKQHRPLGLHVEGGKVLRKLDPRRGKGNFYLKPNGVFSIGKSGAAIIRTSEIQTSR